MIAALLAVFVVALSMFAATPIALAEPESTAAPTTTAAPANPTPSGTTTPDVENSNQGDSETSDNGTPSPPSPQVRPTGSLLIKKEILGLPYENLDQSFSRIAYICVPANQVSIGAGTVVNVPNNGDVLEIKDIPVGHRCHVTASNGIVPDGYTLYLTYSAYGGIVTVKEGQGENDSNLVTVTYQYKLDTAPISIRKVIAGERPAGLNDDTEFTVQYRCDKDSADGTVTANAPTEVKVKANGDPVAGPEFPTGTKCKVVAEKPDEPKFEGY